jgi:membrane-bound ClpP family serine protease
MADTMIITVLPDGTIKTETTPISPANHQSAEQFLQTLAGLTGGEVTRQRKSGVAHAHGHAHEAHAGHGHSHDD